jgi:hypothetical protein
MGNHNSMDLLLKGHMKQKMNVPPPQKFGKNLVATH